LCIRESKKSDPTGRCPWCIAGAAIGFSVDFAAQAAVNIAKNQPIFANYSVAQGLVAAGAGFITGGASALISTEVEGAGAAALVLRAGLNGGVGGVVSAGQTKVLNNLDKVPFFKLEAHKDDVGKSAALGFVFGFAGSLAGDLLVPAIQGLRAPKVDLSAGKINFALQFQEFNNIDPIAKVVAGSQAFGMAIGNGGGFVPVEQDKSAKKEP
jgi:hypothetical protein